jgi:hypothetical protein
MAKSSDVSYFVDEAPAGSYRTVLRWARRSIDLANLILVTGSLAYRTATTKSDVDLICLSPTDGHRSNTLTNLGLDRSLSEKHFVIVVVRRIAELHVSIRFISRRFVEEYFGVEDRYVWRSNPLSTDRVSPELLLGCDGVWRESAWSEVSMDGGFVHRVRNSSGNRLSLNVEATMLLGSRALEADCPMELIYGLASTWLHGNECASELALGALRDRRYLPSGRYERLMRAVTHVD